MADPNIELLARVAAALGDLRERLTFVGGCATGLLITDPAAAPGISGLSLPGNRVIHGVAGSGKTMILGYRAQVLAQALRRHRAAHRRRMAP